MDITRIEFLEGLIAHLSSHPGFRFKMKLRGLDLCVDTAIIPASSCGDLLDVTVFNIFVGGGVHVAVDFVSQFRFSNGQPMPVSEVQRFEDLLRVGKEGPEDDLGRVNRLTRKREGQVRLNAKGKAQRDAKRRPRQDYPSSVKSFNDVDHQLAEMLRGM